MLTRRRGSICVCVCAWRDVKCELPYCWITTERGWAITCMHTHTRKVLYNGISCQDDDDNDDDDDDDDDEQEKVVEDELLLQPLPLPALLLLLLLFVVVLWILACRRRLLTTENRRPHPSTLHLNGFYNEKEPSIHVSIFTLLLFSSVEMAILLSQTQIIIIITSPVWLCMCVANELGRVKRLTHTVHLYRRGVAVTTLLLVSIPFGGDGGLRLA